jgi:putative colanic acid biosynthesis acetyltransferase WcaF
MNTVNLSSYHYTPSPSEGNSFGLRLRRFAWSFAALFFGLLPQGHWFGKIRLSILKSFGSKIGKSTAITNGVNIARPWKLKMGDYVWLGENAWLQNNNAEISIGNNVCISQGAMLLVGNHDYKSPSFDETSKPISIEDGAWIGAKAVVCAGVTVHSHAVLTVNSVATKDLEAYGIYQGNPAVKIRERRIGE